MKYVTVKRFKRENALCGSANIPRGTALESRGNVLFYRGKPVCCATGSVMREYFAANDDGMGLERGKLTQAISRCLAAHNERWQAVYEDVVCQKYEKTPGTDFWLWNFEFYSAPIEDLRHIAALVGAEKGR